MKSFKEFANTTEGVNDPAIFKAVMLAGGPGSGKSFIVGKSALTALGFKLINSDSFFEKALKKAGLKLDPKDIASPKGQELRVKAKALTSLQTDIALNGRLGLIIDGTGRDYNVIKNHVNELRALGYAIHMIFVNTDLETAIERNNNRPRSLSIDIVTTSWKAVQNNIGKFQALFKNRLTVVDNSKDSNVEKATMSVYKNIMVWSKKPPTNKIALKWIQNQK